MKKVEVVGRFQLNSVGMMRRLATLDLGIVLMPEAMVADELASGSLQRVIPIWQGTPVPVNSILDQVQQLAHQHRYHASGQLVDAGQHDRDRDLERAADRPARPQPRLRKTLAMKTQTFSV